MEEDEQWKNFGAYCRKVGGFSWLNALHTFGGEDGNGEFILDTPLTYVISTNSDDWRFVKFLLQTTPVDVNARETTIISLYCRLFHDVTLEDIFYAHGQWRQ